MTISKTDRSAEFRRTRSGSRDLFDRASQVIPAGVNHNIRFVQPFPLYYSRGQGPLKWDVDDNRYVDYSMSSASLLLGHDHAAVRQALADAAGRVPAACHDQEVSWAQLVEQLIPSAERTRFVASGTEATMLAARIARAYTRRDLIVRFEGHYHGWNDYFVRGHKAPFDRSESSGVLEDVLAHTLVLPNGDPEALRATLERGDVAAVFVEPSGGAWGTVPLPLADLELMAREAERTDTLLVFDEMITGFRWSPGGAQARFGITPDMTTLGKILTGGLPGGAVAGRAEVLDYLRPGREVDDGYVFHFGTFNGHPVVAAAGVATLELVKDGAPHKAADDHAAGLRAAIQDQVDELGVDGFVYGESSTFHLYLRSPGARSGDEVTAADLTAEEFLGVSPDIVGALHIELRTRGVDLMSYTGGVTSAVHGQDELDHATEAFEGALRALRDEGLIATR